MIEDFECCFDDDFVRRNLRFLLEDDMQNSQNTNNSFVDLSNESIIYQPSKLNSDTTMTWSSSSSGSMTSSKEEVSNFVNVILRNMSQFNVSSNKISGTGLTESDSQHKDIPKIYSSFSNDLASASTSTPKRKLNFNVPHNDGSTQTSNYEKDKENVHPLQKTFCKFCFKNGEPASVYKSHDTKGNNGIPTCPILRKYVCCFCGGTGDKAHTKKYCPLGKWVEPLRPPFRRLSNGVVVSSHNHK